jgi:hypothetical protein
VGTVTQLNRTSRSPFDAIRHIDTDPERGEFEWWSAREAMPLLGYARWETFTEAIERAKAACRNAGKSVTENFRGAAKVSGQRGPRQQDTQMTRYAMYLVAMNSDPRKTEVAHAQSYFAAQTYRAEQLLPPVVQPEQPQPIKSHPWLERYKRDVLPHQRWMIKHYRPGDWTVVTATALHFSYLEEQLVRHMMQTTECDRPDVSVGLCWATHRRSLGMAAVERFAPLELPNGIQVEVRVYDNAERPMFLGWIDDVYLPSKLNNYLINKPSFRQHGELPCASVADATCRELTGGLAAIRPAIRRQLSALNGFAPVGARVPAIGPSRQQSLFE